MSAVILPWTAVAVGASVLMPDGRRALVTALGRPLGRFREVQLDGLRTKLIDPSVNVPVLFDEESKTSAVLIRLFPNMQVISRGETS